MFLNHLVYLIKGCLPSRCKPNVEQQGLHTICTLTSFDYMLYEAIFTGDNKWRDAKSLDKFDIVNHT